MSSTSALVNDTGTRLIEWVKYLSYGTPFGLPAGDADSDGDADSADETQIQAWSGVSYDVRGDVDLDGDVDGDDETIWQAELDGGELGLDAVSLVGNGTGYTGHRHATSAIHARNRAQLCGRWTTRDATPFYADGLNLYEYVASQPLTHVDPHGLLSCLAGGGTCAGPLNRIPFFPDDSDPTDSAELPPDGDWWSNRYGNYCGSGNSGGAPVMDGGTDSCCQGHDVCYAAAGLSAANAKVCDKDPEQKACDADFVDCLQDADPQSFVESSVNFGAQNLFGQCNDRYVVDWLRRVFGHVQLWPDPPEFGFENGRPGPIWDW